MENKIDFVITWVDGTDKKWQEEKSKYSLEKSNDNRNIRYRDFDLLKYWFRGIEKNAPWVNKIYFVTYGHIPKWLNTKNQKLEIIKHEDFIPAKYLPTFSSTAIEMNLHRINNLSENFVYFNDDMFLLKTTKPDDFFHKNLPCDTAVLSAIVPSGKDSFEHRLVNNINIVNKYYNMHEVIKKNPFKWFNIKYGKEQIRTLLLIGFNNFPAIKYFHIPASLKKSFLEELWKMEPDVLENTSIQKFRNITSVNPWVVQNLQIATGNFFPRKSNFGKFYSLSDNNKKIIDVIKNKKYKVVCLNDSSNIKNFEKVKKELNQAFEVIYSEKSSFEL